MTDSKTGPTPLLPALASFAIGISVGATTVASRHVIAETDPWTLAFLRYTIACLCLVPFVLLKDRPKAGEPWFQRHDILPIAVLGVAQFAVLVGLLNIAVVHISAALASILFSTMPIITFTIAVSLGREKFTLKVASGVLLAILGVAVALGDRATLEPGEALWIGAAAALASAATGGTCNVLFGRYLGRYPALRVAMMAMAAASLTLSVPAFLYGLPAGSFDISPGGWALVLAIGVASGAAFWLWIWALKHAPATKVAVYITVSPIAATLLDAVFLDLHLTLAFITGLFLLMPGLALVTRR